MLQFYGDGTHSVFKNAVQAVACAIAFKGRSKDVRDIGRQLEGDTAIEGSVRKSGNRVRVTVQLVDTQDGYHLFSENYTGDLQHIFATQDQIASAIVRHLRASCDGAPEPARPGSR